MLCNRCVLIVLLVLTNLSHAQDVLPSEHELIRQLVRQVKELQEKVEILEIQQRREAGDAYHSASVEPVISASSKIEDSSGPPPESVLQQLHENHGIQWK